jgi:hypothetical protein
VKDRDGDRETLSSLVAKGALYSPEEEIELKSVDEWINTTLFDVVEEYPRKVKLDRLVR